MRKTSGHKNGRARQQREAIAHLHVVMAYRSIGPVGPIEGDPLWVSFGLQYCPRKPGDQRDLGDGFRS